jgi:dihydrofolate reductase
VSRVVVIAHLTLDGVMQAPGRPDEDVRDGFPHGGWAQANTDPVMAGVMGERMGRDARLLLGRRTYEDLFSFWPRQTNNPFTEALNTMTKYVASRTLEEPLPWSNSTLLRGDATEAVARLREVPGGTIAVLGSGELVQSLMRRDLIDEYLFLIHPLVLGTGRRLFPEGGSGASLRLTSSVITGACVLIATYEARSADGEHGSAPERPR